MMLRIGLLLAGPGVTAHGEMLSMFRTFTTLAIDHATGVAADSSGICVIGNGNQSAPQGQETAGLRKYDSRGTDLWTREFTVPVGEGVRLLAVAANATGVYVLEAYGIRGEMVLRK